MNRPFGNYEKYERAAEEKASSREDLKDIINKAFGKMMDLDRSSEKLNELFKKVRLFLKMLQSYVSGEYRNIPLRTVVAIAASLLYFINPFDLIPDMIPGIGLLDDLAVFIWVTGNINKDILDYEAFLNDEVNSNPDQ
jgi:uncharacterized membrane protein YkvA (DUF1232 family)